MEIKSGAKATPISEVRRCCHWRIFLQRTLWKIHQNLRAITSIMIHKVWSHVARKNPVEKGSPVSAHMALGQVTEPFY